MIEKTNKGEIILIKSYISSGDPEIKKWIEDESVKYKSINNIDLNNSLLMPTTVNIGINKNNSNAYLVKKSTDGNITRAETIRLTSIELRCNVSDDLLSTIKICFFKFH